MSDAHILLKQAIDLMADGDAERAGEAFASALDADGFDELYEYMDTESSREYTSVSSADEPKDEGDGLSRLEREEMDNLFDGAEEEFPGVEPTVIQDGEEDEDVVPMAKSPVTV